MFHFLYNKNSIDFSIFLGVENIMIEFIQPKEFSKELLDKLWLSMQKTSKHLKIFTLDTDYDKLLRSLTEVRTQKINVLLEKDPFLDRKTLNCFSDLSHASQLVVKGGIDQHVADTVARTAQELVTNLFDSELAIATLSRMVVHDPTLYDHSASVAMLGAVIAQKCLSTPVAAREIPLIAQCGLYHDVGKTCVPSVVLNKPGKFTPEEFEVMKTHAALGEEELLQVIETRHVPIDPICARVAGEHHERFGGHGYPKGLKGRLEDNKDNGIHLYSRITTIADVYSALLMKRVYKPALMAQEALKIMSDYAAKDDYDPEIYHRFIKQVVVSIGEYQDLTKANKNSSQGRILTFDDRGKLVNASTLKKPA
jgi:HD-GYP domain-containing protein (c-di-GMP phosphodiesterase class II)